MATAEPADLWMLAYGSAGVVPMGDDALGVLLEVSRRNNARTGVTGMLLYRGGNFFQVLEGGERAVRDLYYRRIELDPRHRGCHPYLQGAAPARMFPGQPMGLRTGRGISTENQQALDGMSADALALGGPARAVKTLMDVFHRIMR